jgi:hypothetical protein
VNQSTSYDTNTRTPSYSKDTETSVIPDMMDVVREDNQRERDSTDTEEETDPEPTRKNDFGTASSGGKKKGEHVVSSHTTNTCNVETPHGEEPCHTIPTVSDDSETDKKFRTDRNTSTT